MKQIQTATLSPHAVLGVSLTASALEIHTAYRALAKRFHPDSSRDPATGQEMARISAAYNVLAHTRSLPPEDALVGPDYDFAIEQYKKQMNAHLVGAPRAHRLDVRA